MQEWISCQDRPLPRDYREIDSFATPRMGTIIIYNSYTPMALETLQQHLKEATHWKPKVIPSKITPEKPQKSKHKNAPR